MNNLADSASTARQTQRLFFALWPPAELSRALQRLAEQTLNGQGRLLPPENIHLTLAFLGSTDAASRECLEQAATAITAKAFTLTLEYMDCWRRAGILWVGSEQVPESLSQLVQALNAGLSACGREPDRRVYAPHLTLARNVRRCPEAKRIPPQVWEVREFHLVQSHTLKDGARYRILRSWALDSP